MAMSNSVTEAYKILINGVFQGVTEPRCASINSSLLVFPLLGKDGKSLVESYVHMSYASGIADEQKRYICSCDHQTNVAIHNEFVCAASLTADHFHEVVTAIYDDAIESGIEPCVHVK